MAQLGVDDSIGGDDSSAPSTPSDQPEHRSPKTLRRRRPVGGLDAVAIGIVRFVATFFGAILVATTAAVLVIRWRDITTSWAAAAAGLTLFAGIPLAGGAVLSWIGGSQGLRITTALVGAIYLATITPGNALIGCGVTRAEDELTVLTANVLRSANEPHGVAETIAATDADIVVLQEVTEEVHDALAHHPLLDGYHYWSPAAGAVVFEPRSSVVVVLSKLGARATDRLELGAAGAADVIFELPAPEAGSPTRTFTLTGVHLNAPSHPRNVGPWRDQLATLSAKETGRPAILAGDFNATEDHRPFRRLLDQGWSDVHDKKGCGFGLTFPVNGMLPVPVMRLDHVLVTDHFEVLGVELLDETNHSDHRPVLAHLRFRDG